MADCEKVGLLTIELLAPAKDLECGIAAIDCGADAVYIGASQFGARESAANSLPDIAELVKYAHKYWARVYATVNTLLRDDEIPQALDLISRLYEIGIDGLIVQDTGLLECDLPPIPLIASTQMHNNTPEKVAFLESVGFQRAILARELDIEAIREIRERTSIELEVFIHGALCVCHSGQCYLSYALGGRSGNRGQCAQPCRKHYSLVDGNGRTIASGHLLSLMDLSLSDHLSELIEAGVCSFKIEGRLKDKAYVTNVVAYYRRKLDGLGIAKSSSGRSIIDFTPNLDKTFNRGYTTYFLHGRRGPVGSIRTPKMVGEAIGRVTDAGKRHATIDTNTSLHRGDGICFFDGSGELRGTLINEVRGRTITPEKIGGIERGTLIYRNHDHEFLTHLEKCEARRVIGVELKLAGAGGRIANPPQRSCAGGRIANPPQQSCGLALVATDEDGNSAEFSIECAVEPARDPDQALENIQKQLTKTGGTDFECTGVTIDLPEAPFVPISTLNALRRGALEKLAEARAANRPVRKGGAIKNDTPYPETKLSYTGNVLNARADAFYRRHGVTHIEPAAESGLDLRSRKVMTTRYCVRHQLGMCESKIKGPLVLIDTEGHRLELRFDCAKCEMEVWLKG